MLRPDAGRSGPRITRQRAKAGPWAFCRVLRGVPVLFLLWAGMAMSGPPFLTDDPEPVPYLHHEFYLFSTFDRSRSGTQLQAPAFELNYGVISNLQAHLVFPFTAAIPRDGSRAYGVGDMELQNPPTRIRVRHRHFDERMCEPSNPSRRNRRRRLLGF